MAPFLLAPLILSSLISPSGLGADAEDGASPWRFVECGREAGIDFLQRSGTAAQEHIVEVKSTGAALLDIDGDGLLDIFFTQGSTIERHRAGEPGFGGRLFRNLGGLRFTEVTESWRIPALGWACGAAAADVDGDGDDDLLITCYGPDRLLRNAGDHFEDWAVLPSAGWSTSAAFADLDGDQDLDLYVAGYLVFDFASPPRDGQPGWSCQYRGQPIVCGPRGFPGQPDTAFAQQANGTFEDATSRWGLAVEQPRYGLGVVIADLVGDARPEIFVANDASPNLLFTHHAGVEPAGANNQAPTNQAATYQEVGFWSGVAYNADGEEQAGMGIDVCDLNDDGRPEVIVTNFEQEQNNLYSSNERGTFSDQADRHGIGPAGREWLSWGVGLRDFDNDGVVDLFVANGHVYPQADQDPRSPGYAQRDHLFVGRRTSTGIRFVERGAELGFQPTVSRGACFGDLDNDGDLDIVVCHLNARPGIYENRVPAGRCALTLSLEQPGPNQQALGARVIVEAGSVRRQLEVLRQASFQCSHDHRLHIGLGATRTEPSPANCSARVRWPDGQWERFAVPAEGGFRKLIRGMGTGKRN